MSFRDASRIVLRMGFGALVACSSASAMDQSPVSKGTANEVVLIPDDGLFEASTARELPAPLGRTTPTRGSLSGADRFALLDRYALVTSVRIGATLSLEQIGIAGYELGNAPDALYTSAIVGNSSAPEAAVQSCQAGDAVVGLHGRASATDVLSLGITCAPPDAAGHPVLSALYRRAPLSAQTEGGARFDDVCPDQGWLRAVRVAVAHKRGHEVIGGLSFECSTDLR